MSCPYCNSSESCEHHLLSIDISEGQACGGELYELFNTRLAQRLSEQRAKDEDIEDSAVLSECISEVEELAASSGREVAGGMTSGEFEDFFCSSSMLVSLVVERYSARHGMSQG
jgi:hypothetical protein